MNSQDANALMLSLLILMSFDHILVDIFAHELKLRCRNYYYYYLNKLRCRALKYSELIKIIEYQSNIDVYTD